MSTITLPLSGHVVESITIKVLKNANAAVATLKKAAALLLAEAERLAKSAKPTKAQVRAILRKVCDKAMPMLASVEDWAVGTMNAPVVKNKVKKTTVATEAPSVVASVSEPTASQSPAPVGWDALATPPIANGGISTVSHTWPEPVKVEDEAPAYTNAAQMKAPTTTTFLPKVMLRVDSEKYELLAQLAKLSVEQLKDLVALAG